MRTLLSLDLGRFNEKTHGGLFHETKGRLKTMSCQTTEDDLGKVLDQAKAAGAQMVVYESQPGAQLVADLVQARGMVALVANTHAEGFAWRSGESKSDRKDVPKLANMAFRGEIGGIVIPEPEDRERRTLVHAREALVGQRSATMNRVRALGVHHWIEMPDGSSCWSKSGLAGLAAMSKNLDFSRSFRASLAAFLRLIDMFNEEIEIFDKHLAVARKKLPRVVQLVAEVPGIGPCTADAVSAYLGNPLHTQVPARAAGAYFGLAPVRRQSGKTVINGRITRAGNSTARGYLVEAAQRAVATTAEWKALFLRMTHGKDDRISKSKAMVAVARRLAVVCAVILRTGTAYDPERIMPKDTWVAIGSA
jgi:transposase